MSVGDDNRAAYEARYKEGYGLAYPDGHVIRIYRHILEYELHMQGGKVLDFGCGSGIHLKYFAEQGFEPYGCDVSETAIARCKALMPEHAANFHVTPPFPKLADYFSSGFDLVFSNQTLYFFPNDQLDDLVVQFNALLKPAGAFVATMMAPTNRYARNVVATQGEMSKIVLEGRVSATFQINLKTREEVLKSFQPPFRRLHLGFYTSIIREDEGPTDHLIFVGQKME